MLQAFTSYVLNMFRTLIYPSTGACDYSLDYHIGRIVLGSMCVGVSVWLGWSGIRVAGFSHITSTPRLCDSTRSRNKLNESANTETAHPWDNLMTVTILRSVEVFLACVIKSYKWSGGTAPLFRNIGTRWKCVLNFTAAFFIPCGAAAQRGP